MDFLLSFAYVYSYLVFKESSCISRVFCFKGSVLCLNIEAIIISIRMVLKVGFKVFFKETICKGVQ